MPTTLTNGIQLPDKGSVDWYSSMQSNYNLIDTHLGDTDVHVTAEDKARWDDRQGSLSQAQLDAIAQVATNTDDIATLQSSKADASHTHSSSDITDINDYATKQYVDKSISGLVDNAPDALNTLKELSTALNDDANFASTVTTALAAKADSSDLATVATSGSYDDLTDTPTIPTNTSDLTNDSNFVVSSSLATVATSGDYDDLSNKPSIPTNTSDLNNDSGFVTLNDFDIPSKTSDLTNDSGFITSSDVPTSTSDLINDSNFVDTSNSAVSSGITSAKVTDYDSHIADTDIHVTTADKNRWNNNTYVFRYSSTALTASSTNSNTLLDNTDNLKVGDKVIDSSGVLFSITAIDTVNSTFTVGSALIDLAKDSDVVHTSGNETITGNKTFNDLQIVGYGTQYKGSRNAYILPEFSAGYSGLAITTLSFAQTLKIGNFVLDANNKPSLDTSKGYIQFATGENNGVNVCILEPRNSTSSSLGTSANKWSKIYGTEYYYGSNNVEFSTKFVTTDTAQTISGNKTFSENVSIYNSDASVDAKYLIFKNQKVKRGSTTETGNQFITFQDKDSGTLVSYEASVSGSGNTQAYINVSNLDANSQRVVGGIKVIKTPSETLFIPDSDNTVSSGLSNYKWKDVQTKLINGLTPSSLGMPSDRSARIDISSYFTNTGTGNTNNYSVPANGFIFLNLLNAFAVICYSIDGTNNINYAQSFYRQVDGQIYILFPVRKNDIFRTLWTSNGGTITVTGAHFIPCLGNV